MYRLLYPINVGFSDEMCVHIICVHIIKSKTLITGVFSI